MKYLPTRSLDLNFRLMSPYPQRARVLQTLIMMLIMISVMMSFIACESQVGDPCVSSTQCAPGQLCDVNSAEGYCTVRDCEEGSCPEGSICVTFESLDRYCMATCAEADDCRDGYTCDEEVASTPVCRQSS